MKWACSEHRGTGTQLSPVLPDTRAGAAHGFMNLHVQWAGFPVLRSISAEEAQPVACGSLPVVGRAERDRRLAEAAEFRGGV